MAATKRFVCIHGHFYQPPRENPWLETVETQDTAAPYHDWNERICSECYSTNGAARIVNNNNKITSIVNNYARISFDFGPTLLDWLKNNEPGTYRMVLDGERQSRKNFNGHSSAMAQVYNHIILPLASRRDRITQIRWGIADYQHHFGSPPEGMWLAETAADSESLELMADHGIKFTVLAPYQCKRIRPLSAGTGEVWCDTHGASVDTSHPYLVRFKSGASIAVFFYDGPTSRAIAFEGLLNSGEDFAARLKAGFKELPQTEEKAPRAQLVHVATDGESYGHHHRHGEMALAYTLRLLNLDKTVDLTNYGSFLEQFPPEYEAEIVENTSWSCEHGVERWRSDCGCNGGQPGFKQAWRVPLRQALDELRDALVPLTKQEGAKLYKNVWEARDGYIVAILDRSSQAVERFFRKQQNHPLTAAEQVRGLLLMEMQRHTQLMYTSCGWFFDDIAGIETVQIIAYASRALQLARELFGEQAKSLEPTFLARLAEAHSNFASAGDGARIYKEQVGCKQLGLEQVAAHYAISSMFSSFAEETDLFCFRVQRNSWTIYSSGRGRLALGRAHIDNAITFQQQSFSFAVLHFGDQNITAAVAPYDEAQAAEFDAFSTEIANHVQLADFPEVIRMLDRQYGHVDYSLISLFTDEQRRILQIILDSTLLDIENSLATIYEDHASLLHYLSRAGLPKPSALSLAAGFAVNAKLRHAMESAPLDQAVLHSYISLAKADQIPLDTVMLSYIADKRMKAVMVELQMSSGSLEILDQALALARTLLELPFELNLWQAQNIWYEILRTSSYSLTGLIAEGRSDWDKSFFELGTCLSIDCGAISAQTPELAIKGDAPLDGRG
jgi:alpha-amylase/alpha-mannosidase (GH57 family)